MKPQDKSRYISCSVRGEKSETVIERHEKAERVCEAQRELAQLFFLRSH